MPIDFERKIILVHVPKNGGTTVERGLGMQHTGHRNWRRFLNEFPKEWATFRRVAIVRNPLDRLVSCYEYARMERSYWHAADGKAIYDKHPDYDTCHDLSFEAVARALTTGGMRLWHSGWTPQHEWIYDDRLRVDELIPLERLDAWLEALEVPDAPRLNPSDRHAPVEDYYSPELERLVREHFAFDFTLHEYALENPPTAPFDPANSRRGLSFVDGVPGPVLPEEPFPVPGGPPEDAAVADSEGPGRPPMKLLVCCLIIGAAHRERGERLFRSLPEGVEILILSDLPQDGIFDDPRVHWRIFAEDSRHPIHKGFAWHLKARVLELALEVEAPMVLYLDGDCFFVDPSIDVAEVFHTADADVLTLRGGGLAGNENFLYARQIVEYIRASDREDLKAVVDKAKLPLEQAILIARRTPEAHAFVRWWLELARMSIALKLYGDPDAVDLGLALELSGVRHRPAKEWLQAIRFTAQGNTWDLRHERIKHGPERPPHLAEQAT